MKFKGSLIVLKDCKKALKFYQEMFGFELIRDHDGNMELSGNLYLRLFKIQLRMIALRNNASPRKLLPVFFFLEIQISG